MPPMPKAGDNETCVVGSAIELVCAKGAIALDEISGNVASLEAVAIRLAAAKRLTLLLGNVELDRALMWSFFLFFSSLTIFALTCSSALESFSLRSLSS